jgi:RNA polymerase sigma factor (sigma-70 family)
LEELGTLYDKLYIPVKNELKRWGCKDQFFYDLYHDAFFILIQNMSDPGNEIRYPQTYIAQMCKYLWIKERKRQNSLEIVEETETIYDSENELKDELNLLLSKHFKNLPPACQKILNLYCRGYSESKINKLMNLSNRAAVKNKKFYCKEKLRSMIKIDPLYKEING